MSIFFLIIHCFHLYKDCMFTGHKIDINKMEFGEWEVDWTCLAQVQTSAKILWT